jgi:protein SCO1/2
MDYWVLKTAKMFRTVFLTLISCLLFHCKPVEKDLFVLPYYNEPTFTPLFLSDTNEVQKQVTHRIGDFSFLNQDSVGIDQGLIEGKIHVANFIFTSCGSICPVMTKNFKLVGDSLANNEAVVFLSYSVTPWIDSPSVLKKYKADNQIENENWHFLTGDKSAIYSLARKSYFAEEELGYTKDSTEFLHTEHFILVDKDKRIRGVYNGTLRVEMTQLLEDITVLLDER